MVKDKYDFTQRNAELQNDFLMTMEWFACRTFCEKLRTEQMEKTIANYNGIKLDTYAELKAKYNATHEPNEW